MPKRLTQEQQAEVDALRERFGDRAADALADSMRATDAFNATSGGDFTGEAWQAGLQEITLPGDSAERENDR